MSSVELRRRSDITNAARALRKPGETLHDAMERLTRGVLPPITNSGLKKLNRPLSSYPAPGRMLMLRVAKKREAERQRKFEAERAARLALVHAELRRTRPARNTEAVRRFAEYERNLQIELLERAIAKTIAAKQLQRAA